MKVRVEIDLQNGTLASAEFDVPEHIVPRRMNQYNEALSHVVGGAPLETAPVGATEPEFAERKAWYVNDPKYSEWWTQAEEPSAETKLVTPRYEYARCVVISEKELDSLRARLAEAERVTEEQVERAAPHVYDAMRSFDAEGARYPWVAGGNSDMQDRARRVVRAAITAARGGG